MLTGSQCGCNSFISGNAHLGFIGISLITLDLTIFYSISHEEGLGTHRCYVMGREALSYTIVTHVFRKK